MDTIPILARSLSMVPSYCAYITDYVLNRGPALRAPGEHHFVCAYLVPKLFAMNRKIPDYINPDGTKAILGDVVYYKDGRHHFGIEVKLGTVRLTKREFNEWIVGSDRNAWPNLFIGIGHQGLILTNWDEFREAYKTTVGARRGNWLPQNIEDGYGPTTGVDQLRAHLSDDAKFPLVGAAESAMQERRFTESLERYIPALNPPRD